MQTTNTEIQMASVSQNDDTAKLDFRRAARKPVLGFYRVNQIKGSRHGAHINTSTPVEIVAGSDEAPHVEGLPYLKTGFNNGHGFSITLFTPSTMRVVVGENWKA